MQALLNQKHFKKSKKWLTDWVSQPINNKRFYVDPIVKLRLYLMDDLESFEVPRMVQKLGLWHLVCAETKSLDNDDTSWTHFSTSALCYLSYILCENQSVRNGDNSLLLPSELGLTLSMIMIYLPNEKIPSQLLNIKLESSDDFFKSQKYVHALINKKYNNAFVSNQYNNLKNQNPYDRLLDSVNSPDINIVDSIVSECCDYHVSQSNNTNGNQFVEFEVEYLTHYVPEILAWLSYRAWKGYDNPTNYKHQLMQLPFNQIPKKPYEPFQEIKSLLDAVKSKMIS